MEMSLSNWSDRKAILSFSGGQDSSTCLLHLLRMGAKPENLHLVTFRYGQRHREAESDAAVKIRNLLKIPIDNHHFPTVTTLGHSHLTSVGDITAHHPRNEKLPASFVPGRNLLFTMYVAQIAYNIGIDIVVLGVNAVDFSGYPDCREEAIRPLKLCIQKGFDWPEFKMYCPLIFLDKANIIREAFAHPKGKEVMALSHTCYEGQVPGCGKCPACKVRADGFAAAGEVDPRFSI